jgi:hypothetical protein
MKSPGLKRRIGKIAFDAGAVLLLAMGVFLLPILLPAIAVSEAWEIRKLARTRCVRCGNRIGITEIRRAKQDGIAQAWAAIGGVPSLWRRRRVVAVWNVTCPTCGHEYTYRSDADRRHGLVSKEPGSDGAISRAD